MVTAALHFRPKSPAWLSVCIATVGWHRTATCSPRWIKTSEVDPAETLARFISSPRAALCLSRPDRGSPRRAGRRRRRRAASRRLLLLPLFCATFSIPTITARERTTGGQSLFLPASDGAQTTASGGAPTVPLAGVRELSPESAPLSSGPVEVPFAPKGCSSSPHLGLPMRVGIERNRRGHDGGALCRRAQGPLR